MPFTSVSFLIIFLPVVFAVTTVLNGRGKNHLTIYWLLAASLYFYGHAQIPHLLLLIALTGLNFIAGRSLLQSAFTMPDTRLVSGAIALNVAVLIFFKYDTRAAALAPSFDFGMLHYRLPVGLSFFIFMQIAHLSDAYHGETVNASWKQYFLFSLWFPYILSGPIVKSKDVIPQFGQPRSSESMWRDAAVGVTLISIGLFKKMILCAMVAPMAKAFFNPSSVWTHAGFLETWIGVISYSLNIYFDFSGYSDMAVGVGRLFGIRLPVNFNSPFKATNIIEYWTRWHMTLTRFLTQYIYNPLTVAIVRWRAEKGISVPQQNNTTWSAYFTAVGFPLMVTMFISGIWHGAGWTFVVFGLLHGVYLTLNHGWHVIQRRLHWTEISDMWWFILFGRVVTLVSVFVAFVFFGACSCRRAGQIFAGMIGLHGFDLPDTLQVFRPHVAAHLAWMHPVYRLFPFSLPWGVLVVTLLGILVAFFPNSQEWLSAYEPALHMPTFSPKGLRWRPDVRHGLISALLAISAFIAVVAAPAAPGFIYFQF